MKLTIDAATINEAGKYPVEAMEPVRFGYNEVEFAPGDYVPLFAPKQAARYFSNGASINAILQSVNGAIVEGFRIKGQLPIRSSCENVIVGCRFDAVSVQPIRIRFGSHRNTIKRCHFQRSGPIPTSDVIGIYFSDGPNLDNDIIGNTILNYTDAVQLGRGASDAELEHAAGTCICDNVFGITKDYHKPDGSMVQGLEQAGWDIKTGGTEAKPIFISRNLVFGCRPVVLSGAGSPGYACTYHLRANHVHCSENTYVDCEAVHFLNMTYNDAGQYRQPVYTFEREQYIDIRSHGFASPWPMKQGSVFCGPNTAKILGGTFFRCDRKEEMVVPSWVPEVQQRFWRVVSSNIWT